MEKPIRSTEPAKMGAPTGVSIIPGTCAPPWQFFGQPNGTTNGIYDGKAGKPTKPEEKNTP
jgi:hypothetical protein